MNIKTITCHDVYNHGSALQAYALMAHLKKMGHDVEIINYLPPYLRIRTHLLSVSSNWIDKPWFLKLFYLLGKIPGRLLWPHTSCKKRFDLFNKRHLRVTKRLYRSCKELRDHPPEADLYITGSDQIWNTAYNNGRDPAFYLDFGEESSVRISYAASFGLGDVLSEYEPFVRRKLAGLNDISVREKRGVEIIEKLGFKARHVCDPVFLLDREDWDALSKNGIKPKEPYILIYDFEVKDEFRAFAMQLARKLKMPVYSINNYHRCPYADLDFYKSGPEDFISLIKNAELLMSNSFHATAFSIIFGTKFYALPRLTDKVNSRMESLLESCGLQDRFIPEYWERDVDELFPLSSYECSNGYNVMVSESKEYLFRHLVQ